MATKKPPAKKAPSKATEPPKRSEPKPQARSQDSKGFTAEATPLPVDKDHEALEQERAELQQPGKVSKRDAEQIDNDPGYDKDQLAHMKEYWGLTDSIATEAEEGQVVEEVV